LTTNGHLQEAHDVAQRWLASHPDDAPVLLADATALGMQATADSDAGRAKALRKLAHAEAKRAKDLKLDEPMVDIVLNEFDADGNVLLTPNRLAGNAAAVAEMQAGEKAFSAHDLETARAHYQRALALDPHSYDAALYIGDTYFNDRKFDDAVMWFNKAVAIDPDREAAYRYLGDTYQQRDRLNDAEAAYIQAVLASPYRRPPREMLSRLAHRRHREIAHPKVDLPVVTVELTDKGVNVGLDKDNIDTAAVAYAVARAKWLQEDRPKYFAKDVKPRHSLPEECDGLRTLLKIAEEVAQNGQPMKEHADAIKTLADLDRAGLLEPYVLLDRADECIAEDYVAYRKLHRLSLERYIREIWLGENDKSPPAAAAKR